MSILRTFSFSTAFSYQINKQTKVLFGWFMTYSQHERHYPMKQPNKIFITSSCKVLIRNIQCIGILNMEDKKSQGSHPRPSPPTKKKKKNQPDLSSVSSKSTLKEWPLLLMILAEFASYLILRGCREESYFTSLVLISIGDC